LEFDIDSLRIRDLAEDEEYKEFDKRKSTIFDSLKKSSIVNPEPIEEGAVPQDPTQGSNVGRIKSDTDTTKLRQFLNNIDKE